MLTTTTTTSFEDILDELETLARDHLLFFRVQVGNVLLRHFWQDDPHQFSDRGRGKAMRFDLFYEKCGDALRRYGLSRRQAIDSVRAAIVVRSLPTALAEQLFLSQVMALTRLRDPSQRVDVAQAALAMDWSVTRLRDVVEAVRAGLPVAELDRDVGEDGELEASADAEAGPLGKIPAPGRLVTQAEKLAAEVNVWASRWERVDASRLRRVQRERLMRAADELEAQVARLRRVVGAETAETGETNRHNTQ